jgi:hypothetical protein
MSVKLKTLPYISKIAFLESAGGAGGQRLKVVSFSFPSVFLALLAIENELLSRSTGHSGRGIRADP